MGRIYHKTYYPVYFRLMLTCAAWCECLLKDEIPLKDTVETLGGSVGYGELEGSRNGEEGSEIYTSKCSITVLQVICLCPFMFLRKKINTLFPT